MTDGGYLRGRGVLTGDENRWLHAIADQYHALRFVTGDICDALVLSLLRRALSGDYFAAREIDDFLASCG